MDKGKHPLIGKIGNSAGQYVAAGIKPVNKKGSTIKHTGSDLRAAKSKG